MCWGLYVVQLSKGLHPVPGNVYLTQYHSFFLGIEKNEIEIQEHVCKLTVLYFPVPLVQKLIKGTRFVFLLFKRIFLKKISVFFLEQPIFNLWKKEWSLIRFFMVSYLNFRLNECDDLMFNVRLIVQRNRNTRCHARDSVS